MARRRKISLTLFYGSGKMCIKKWRNVLIASRGTQEKPRRNGWDALTLHSELCRSTYRSSTKARYQSRSRTCSNNFKRRIFRLKEWLMISSTRGSLWHFQPKRNFKSSIPYLIWELKTSTTDSTNCLSLSRSDKFSFTADLITNQRYLTIFEWMII